MPGKDNINIFLDMIAKAEGTLNQPDPYRVVYGYGHIIQDLSTHPAISGEWRGKILKPQYCKKVGLKPGCKSTASGKYQITKGTFIYYSEKLGIVSFYPEDQDAIAIGILEDIGAMRYIKNGSIERAIIKASLKWASFPGSLSGQPQRKMDELIAFYRANSGEIA
jgi:lysozyme